MGNPKQNRVEPKMDFLRKIARKRLYPEYGKSAFSPYRKLQINYIILSPVCQQNFNEFFKARSERSPFSGSKKQTALILTSAVCENSLTDQGRRPIPPSSVRVSPFMNLKSGEASCTHTLPISVSGSPK